MDNADDPVKCEWFVPVEWVEGLWIGRRLGGSRASLRIRMLCVSCAIRRRCSSLEREFEVDIGS